MSTFFFSSHHFLLLFLFTSAPLFSSSQHLPTSQFQTLFRLRRILEYPSPLSSWNRHTSFCSLPSSPFLSISCSTSGQITLLSIIGNHTSLSPNFTSDSLFRTLSKLNTLTTLSLVSLGMWGSIPSEINSLSSLKVLNLSMNRFNGTVPDLNSMTFLSDLDLSGNFLGPEFPSLGKSIVTLELRNNKFRENVLVGFASMDRLQKLDLSFNHLSGMIPPFFFSMPSVRYLDFSANKFKGVFPANLSCGVDLGFVDISRNFFMGSLPLCIRSNSSNLVVLNSWNCLSAVDSRYQHPNSYCNGDPLAAILPDAKKERSKTNLGLLLSLVGGILGGVVVIGLLVFLVLKKMKSKNNVIKCLCIPTNGSTSIQFFPKTLADTRHMSQAVIIGTMGLTPYRLFTMEELDEATNGFEPSNLVSEGPQGQFFKGWLQDGSTVLVRSIKLKQKNSSQILLQYIDVISKLRHRHLVSILGHCIITSQENSNTPTIVFLVFEYFSNGSLRSHITEWRKREMLKWSQRVTAVIGIARGMQFLHAFMAPGIVGNDLHIDNILLDETLTAKISNYKLPFLPKNKNNMVGCECPFDVGQENDIDSIPNFENAEKEDIYQLGLILLEVITGKPAGLQGELDALKVQLQKSLNEAPVKLGALADPTIRNTFAYDSLKTAVVIALNCLAKDPRERPSVDDVLWNLQYCVQIQNGWASSESLSMLT